MIDADWATYAWVSIALGFAACVADAAIDRWRWRRAAESMRRGALAYRLRWHKGD